MDITPQMLMATCIVSHTHVCVWSLEEVSWDVDKANRTYGASLASNDRTRMISCSSSNEMLCLCLRLLRLLDVTLESRVNGSLLRTDGMTAG